MIPFILKYKMMLIGILIGAVAGYAYYYFVGCAGGTCPISSKPLNSTLYGALAGAVFFSDTKSNKSNKLNTKIGVSAGLSNVQPAGGGAFIGAEVNGNIQYNFGPYMSLELHGAYLSLGDFYDSKQAAYGSPVNGDIDGRPTNPWTAFLVFKWLMF